MGKFVLQPESLDAQYPDREDLYENLGGLEVTVLLKFSERLQVWYLDLLDLDKVVLYASRKLLGNYSVAIRQRVVGLPPGIFYVDSETPDDTPPNFEALGTRVVLAYSDPEDIPPPPPLTDAVKIEVV